MKNKNRPYSKIKKQRFYRKTLTVITLVAIICVSSVYFAFWYETKEAQATNVNFPRLERPEVIELYTQDEVKQYIKSEAEKAGIVHVDILLKTISCESKFRQFAVNKNTNGTWDKGIWMINSIHRVPDDCAFDLECSTKWAMQKIKERKFSPWTCYTAGYYKAEQI